MVLWHYLIIRIIRAGTYYTYYRCLICIDFAQI